jgi:predicted AlkP superfamily pyrophosphatase or phosphodiesterase
VPLLASQPDLILQITVDQLRADMLTRFSDRFGEGGFKYLAEQGTVYTDARYTHLNTMTAVGHATLATGGNSPQHGMAANDWYDRELGRKVNSVEDVQSPFVGGVKGDRSGRSPRHLTSSTFSDELVLASGGRSRAFGVSTKDRGAIITAGRQGQAYWYSSKTGEYVTSTWYRDSYPEWVSDWNSGKPADAYLGKTWDLFQDRDRYIFADQDDRAFEIAHGKLGTTFPHVMADPVTGPYYSNLRRTPWADELTLQFTLAMMQAEQIGQRGHTDYLSVSFSATDYIGHAFGPNSLEAEDNLLRLDRTLAQLFEAVDEAVGLENTLIVLSADHGVQAAPEHMAEHGFEVGRLGTDTLLGTLNEAMADYFQTSEPLVAAFLKPGLYLDAEALHRAGVSMSHAEAKLAREVLKIPGFSHAFTRSALQSGAVPDTPVARSVLNAFHPERSGDVLVVPEQFWFFGWSAGGDASTHGTPYPSDQHVPIVFAGPGIGKQVIHRRVAPRDVAPTLSAIMGILPPSGSVGKVLQEVVSQ